jgi:hypothetical protein
MISSAGVGLKRSTKELKGCFGLFIDRLRAPSFPDYRVQKVLLPLAQDSVDVIPCQAILKSAGGKPMSQNTRLLFAGVLGFCFACVVVKADAIGPCGFSMNGSGASAPITFADFAISCTSLTQVSGPAAVQLTFTINGTGDASNPSILNGPDDSGSDVLGIFYVAAGTVGSQQTTNEISFATPCFFTATASASDKTYTETCALNSNENSPSGLVPDPTNPLNTVPGFVNDFDHGGVLIEVGCLQNIDNCNTKVNNDDVFFFSSNGDDGDTSKLAIQFLASTAPEPATFGGTFCGLAALLIGYRYRSRRPASPKI